MTRSKWKFFYVDPVLMYQLNYLNNLPAQDDEDVSAALETDVIATWSRNSTILPEFIGSLVEVHNGQSFFLLRIKSNMVRHKLGEFALTKKTGSRIHILKKKKK